MKTFNRSLRAGCVVAVLLALAGPASAVPTFQTYIEGATAGNFGADVDTWLSSSPSFNLVLVGAYQGNITSLTNGTLVVSVPEGQTGTLTVDSLAPITLGANEDVLTNVLGNDAFDTKTSPPFPLSDSHPGPETFNEHYPFQAGVSDFILFEVGSFANLGPIHNYSADTGTITTEGSGEEKVFPVTVSGFSWAHFDLFGEVGKTTGSGTTYSWEISPGSHDSSYIPAPGALLLVGMGSLLVGWARRRKLV